MVMETESPAEAEPEEGVGLAVPKKLTPKVAAVVLSDNTVVVVVEFVAVSVSVVGITTACDGTELRTPRPKAAAATSAMRLKFVFVDIISFR